MFNAKNASENLIAIGQGKANMNLSKMLVLGILAGIFIAFGGAISSTVAHSIKNVGIARLLSGCTFATGLTMVVLLGAELFTGNNLMIVSKLQGEISWGGLMKNWSIVFIANFIGAIFVAVMVVFCNQLNYSDGGLAVYAMKLAISKGTMGFIPAFLSGVLCNILVCTAVFMSMCAKDVIGKIAGAFIPIMVFVTCGFEHSIANMFYGGAGLFAGMNPIYIQKATEAGLNLQNLTWGNFLVGNLLPVTLGNIVGGALIVGVSLWFSYVRGGACAKVEEKISA